MLLHRVRSWFGRVWTSGKRTELSEAPWQRIAAMVPGRAGDPGRTGWDNWLVVNGCLWVLRWGAPLTVG
ncbi:hypothetical protein [Geminicoccus roseus]|uniref:hypothetical protein n=1 Tax=Geminicoccus roseus TaxID=404900 RepID=UPI003899362C